MYMTYKKIVIMHFLKKEQFVNDVHWKALSYI